MSETLTFSEGAMAKANKVSVQSVALNKIKTNQNSRMDIRDEELSGLMQSIKEVGLLQPIGLIPSDSGGYEVCYGNRRFLACSKLGLSSIPAVVHDTKKASDINLKNLTENIQRRNLTLTEVGRYLTILKDQGLSSRESAVRLGVSKTYVNDCLDAFNRVPEKHRDDLAVRIGGERKQAEPGKIGIRTAQAILSARKTHGLTEPEVDKLFQAAKQEDGFAVENISKYVKQIRAGKKRVTEDVEKIKTIRLNLTVTESEFERLHAKYVAEGPFRSMTALCEAILKGEKSERIKVL